MSCNIGNVTSKITTTAHIFVLPSCKRIFPSLCGNGNAKLTTQHVFELFELLHL